MNLFEQMVSDEVEQEQELQSSVGQIETFAKSFVWSDIKDIILARISQAQILLESAPTMEDVRELRGEIKSFRFLLGLPDVMLELKKEEEKHKEGEVSYGKEDE